MQHPFRVATLAELDSAGIASAYNVGYEDYVVPLRMDADAAAGHICINDIVLDASPLWLDQAGNVAAFAALGVRGRRGWIGGFGIARNWRGRGMGHRLAAETLASARRLGLRDLQLEVFTSNRAAISVYRAAGFEITRDLLILSRSSDIPHLPDAIGGATVEHLADVAPLLSDRPAVTSVEPPWQRESPNTLSATGSEGLRLTEHGVTTAFAIHTRNLASASRSLLDIAASSPSAARRVIRSLIALAPGDTLRCVNEPEDSPAAEAMLAEGFVEILRQHEMRLSWR